MGWIDDEFDIEHFLKKKGGKFERQTWESIRARIRRLEQGAEIADKVIDAVEVLAKILDIVRDRKQPARPRRRRKK